MKEVFKVWCEWDIGLSDCVFGDFDLAWEYAENALRDADIDVQESIDHCLVGVETVTVINE